MCGTDAFYLWRLCIFQTVRRHGLVHPAVNWGSPGDRGLEHPTVNCGLPGDQFVRVLEVYPEDLPQVLGEDCVTLAQGEYGKDSVSLDSVSSGLNTRPLQTRRTTVTAVGTGSSNHCLHRASWFYFLNPSISSYMCWWNWSLLFEEFDWRLSQFPHLKFFKLPCSSPAYPLSRYL